MSITNCCCHCEAIPRCVLQIYAVIARILFKMRIANLCCHSKNFIQNAYRKLMLSLQEFSAKRVLQIYAVIARILSSPYTAIILWGFSSKQCNKLRTTSRRKCHNDISSSVAPSLNQLESRQENRALTLKLIEKLIVRGRI